MEEEKKLCERISSREQASIEWIVIRQAEDGILTATDSFYFSSMFVCLFVGLSFDASFVSSFVFLFIFLIYLHEMMCHKNIAV